MKLRHVNAGLLCAVLAAGVLVGCNSNGDGYHEVEDREVQEGGHAHPQEGPHGGHIADLGGGAYHVEIVDDDVGGTLTIFLLGDDAKSPAPIDAEHAIVNLVENGTPRQFRLPASPDEADPEGRSSRFTSQEKELADLLHAEGAEPRLVVTIDGKQYTADLHHDHGQAHGHSHTGDDALVWEQDEEQDDYRIRLGHHGKHLHAGESVEPAVAITRDGKPVPDARVFNALLSADGKRVLAEEVPTVYEPPTDEEPAHYAQGELDIPAGVEAVIIRFRITLPGVTKEPVYDVSVPVEQP